MTPATNSMGPTTGSYRAYVAGAIILWAGALQAHVWSLPEHDLKKLRGAAATSASASVSPVSSFAGRWMGTRDGGSDGRMERDG